VPSLTRVVSSPASYWGSNYAPYCPLRDSKVCLGGWPAGWATPRQAGTLSCCRAAGLAGGHRPGAHSALPGKTVLITTPGRPRGPPPLGRKGAAPPCQVCCKPAATATPAGAPPDDPLGVPPCGLYLGGSQRCEPLEAPPSALHWLQGHEGP
jgi:hypothetical protein